MLKSASRGKNISEDFETEVEEDFEEEKNEYNFTSILNKNAAENRRIYLWGEVTENTAISVISQLHYFAEENNNPVQLVIHSTGGELDAGLAIIDEMMAVQNSGIIVNTIVTGKAYSAAALILLMGSTGYRWARTNASIMLHPVSYGMGADYSDYQEKMTVFFKSKNKELNEMVGKKIGLKTAKQLKGFISDIDKGLWLSPQEALDRKIIDKIIYSKLPVNKGR